MPHNSSSALDLFPTLKNLHWVVEGEFLLSSHQQVSRHKLHHGFALTLCERNRSVKPGSSTSYSSVFLPRISARAFSPAVSHFPTKMPLPAERFSLFTQEHFILYILSWSWLQTGKNYTLMFTTWPVNMELLKTQWLYQPLYYSSKCLPTMAPSGSYCWIYAPLKRRQFRAIWTDCWKASFAPRFYSSFTTTELNCLLFQGNSRAPRKT